MQSNYNHSLKNGIIRILQFTDTHIAADPSVRFDGVDTLVTLQQVIAQARLDCWPPTAMVVSGDLVSEPHPEDYHLLKQQLDELNIPVYYMPGNHDDPRMMAECLIGGNTNLSSYAQISNWRLIFVSTYLAGSPAGQIADDELLLLRDNLQASRTKDVLIFIHHPVTEINSPWIDGMKLQNAEAFFDLIDRYHNIRGVFCGHIHQEHFMLRRNVPYFGTPSTCVQFKPRAIKYEVDLTLAPGYRWIELAANGIFYTGVKRVCG